MAYTAEIRRPYPVPIPTRQISAYFRPDDPNLNESIQNTKEVLDFEISYFNSNLKKVPSAPKRKVSQHMCHLVKEFIDKNGVVIGTQVTSIKFTRETLPEVIASLTQEILEGEDFEVSWSRMVALYAIVSRLAIYCMDLQMENCVEQFPEWLGTYIALIAGNWLEKQGGWEGIYKSFPAEGPQGNRGFRDMLPSIAVGIGLFATLLVTSRP